MIVVNLEKYAEENYYKQPANSPGAASPDNITHARLYYDTFAGSDYLQGSFVSNNNSTVQFDNSAISDSVFKLFVSTDGTTYTELKTYGGTEGRDEFSSAMVIDGATYDDYDIPTALNDVFVPKSLTEIVEAGTLSMNDYYFVRGKLHQDNTLYSGRPFFGSVSVNAETGALVGSSSSYFANSANNLVNTVSNYVYRTGGAKVTTGTYYLQCQVGATTGAAVNGFITALNGSAFRYKFENSVFPVYGSRTIAPFSVEEPRNISHIQRLSGSAVRIKLTGVSDYTEFDPYIGYSYVFADVTGDISPTVNGTRVLTVVGADYLEFAHTSSSGTGTFAVVTGTINRIDGYTETYVPGLAGYVVLDVNDTPLTYYDTGKLLIKTYNTSWVLTDDILTIGCTLVFKAQKISY